MAESNKTNTEIANKYQKKTDKQHILDNPDTYIGSVENIDATYWLFNDSSVSSPASASASAEDDASTATTAMVQKKIQYIPGLFKLFDEAIVNCRDHVIRMQQAIQNNVPQSLPVTTIDVTVQKDTGMITMMNDGNGIDVVKHPEYDLWIPELIFGNLRTSTNFNKEEKKIVGGKNGFGVKLIFIWSVECTIETVDHIRGLKYVQEFKNNLNQIMPPKITKVKGKPYTKISFRPDYARFGVPEGLTEDTFLLFKKRAYDISAVTDKAVKVKFNGDMIPVKNFQQYIDLYIGNKDATPRVYEEGNDRWEYAVALSPTQEFIQISFVNGIHTHKGGKHVEYILNQITRKLCEYIEKKKKVAVNPSSIKEQLILFLRCDIENPAFDSQTKDYMNTPIPKFGSKCDVSDKMIEKIAKMGVMDSACAITEVKENKNAKKTDGTKSKNIRGIPKLVDANWAGTEKSKDCVIIFCEGDSAKAGIISGLSSEDRNTIGVYPMKGKILNVRGENVKKISENKEIAEIKKILGLESGKKYETIEDVHKHLRYGKIMFLCDADTDGSHIKGLGINLFQDQWPSLTRIDGFIGYMNTPILKARKGTQELMFYNNNEYEAWKQEQSEQQLKSWKIKYYKGLGTSTGKEFREYFQNKKLVGFQYDSKTSDNMIDMVFNKKRADDRKNWLGNYHREDSLNTNHLMVTYDDFINKELIHFSKYDCDRSIPNLMDGLKISLRKIMYSAFKRNLTSEIKVAQFSGYVSEHSGYHHGEASLNGAIVGLAQNFVGSNNINLLMPNGQFGGRTQGGDDHASERYIFTQLNPITRHIFQKSDDAILKYLDDDGLLVEPIYYAPIIPMVLVNGTEGIGTGFSTSILCYHPMEIMDYLKNKLEGTVPGISAAFTPYYEGFQGTITRISANSGSPYPSAPSSTTDLVALESSTATSAATSAATTVHAKYLIKGRYTKVGTDKIHVTELPIGLWTEKFKEHLESLIEPVDKNGKKLPPIIKDYDDMSKDTTIDFTITFAKGKIEELESIQMDHGCNGLEKLLKLYTTQTTSNMHLFDAEEKLKKYDTVEQIIDDYFGVRLGLYQKRKEVLIRTLTEELKLLSNKKRYILETLEGVIDLRRKRREEIHEILATRGYDTVEDDEDYKYLVKMPMDSVCQENVERIEREHEMKTQELDKTTRTSAEQMWIEELDVLKAEYVRYVEDRERSMFGGDGGEETGAGKKVKNLKKSSGSGSGSVMKKKIVATKSATN